MGVKGWTGRGDGVIGGRGWRVEGGQRVKESDEGG